MKDSVFREKHYRTYLDFLKSAETKRRWNVFDHIPWDQLDPSKANAQTLLSVEHTCTEELYLPDYSSKVMPLLRASFGHAWFWANWSYEESKHGLALREYLVRSGHLSNEAMAEFEDRVSSLQWELPFPKLRQMTCYGALQETATYLAYKILRDRAATAGDKVLEAIFSLIGRDEAAHAGFYRTLLAIDMEQDREGTMADMAFVIPRFKMPVDGIAPGYGERLVACGLPNDTAWYIEKVVMPTLISASTSWDELRAHSRKHGGSAELPAR